MRPRLKPPFPILCFGYHPWSPMWKRNQSMMAALARRPAIEQVVFINPEVTLLTPFRELAGELRSLRRYSWRGVWPHHPLREVEVRTPLYLPLRGRSAAVARLNRALLRQSVLRFGGRPFLLFVNGVRVESAEIVALVEGEASFQVFDWSDDFAEFPRDLRHRREIESLTELRLRRADLILAVNENLAARARPLGVPVEVVPNATGLLAAAGPPSPGARAFARRLQHPVLGYCGFINEHRVDLELVGELARRHPDWTVLFLGVVQSAFDSRFPPLPNLIFHPPVPHGELRGYLEQFDVCLIPHLINAHTEGNNPLKIYDYLSTGRPVVSTAIAGVEGFEDVITVAPDRPGFIAAVESAVETRMSGKENEARVEARRARAAEHTWEARARQVEAALLQGLGSLESRAPIADRSSGSPSLSGSHP